MSCPVQLLDVLLVVYLLQLCSWLLDCLLVGVMLQ